MAAPSICSRPSAWRRRPRSISTCNAAPAPGVLRKTCAGVIRTIAAALDGTPFIGVEAICGDAFFDNLIAHPEVRATYTNWQAAEELRQGYVQGGQVYGAFPFGGIMWTNYRGQVGTQPYINTDKCHMYASGSSPWIRWV
nr:major capsid protein [Bradyrhizobium sp. Cp5.3]